MPIGTGAPQRSDAIGAVRQARDLRISSFGFVNARGESQRSMSADSSGNGVERSSARSARSRRNVCAAGECGNWLGRDVSNGTGWRESSSFARPSRVIQTRSSVSADNEPSRRPASISREVKGAKT